MSLALALVHVLSSDPVDPSQVEPVVKTFTLDANLTLIVSAFLIPLATALITKYAANAFVKQVVSVAFAGLVTIFNQAVVNGQAVFSKETLMLWFAQALAAAGVYLVGYKPHEVGEKLAPNFGIGAAKTPARIEPITC
jgi:hypothetical protein